MAESQKIKRRIWTKAETELFLDCYKERQEEFKNVRKKRQAYENLLETMIFRGFQDTSVTTVALEGKMRNLLLSYKSANENNKRTGASPCTVPYYEVSEEHFEVCESNMHTLNLGTTIEQPCTETFYIIELDDHELLSIMSSPHSINMNTPTSTPIPTSSRHSTNPNTPTSTPIPTSSPHSTNPNTPTSSPISTSPIPTSSFILTSPIPTSSFIPTSSCIPTLLPIPTSSPIAPSSRKRQYQTAKERYYEQKLELKKQHYKQKEILYQKLTEFVDKKLNKNK